MNQESTLLVLDYENTEGALGTLYLFPDCVPLSRHHKLETLYARFRNQIEQHQPSYLTDSFLFNRYPAWYRTLWELICPRIDVASLTAQSRTLVFLYSDPVPDPEDPSKRILGLSGIEWFLGYKHQKRTSELSNRVVLTTRRADLDVVGRLLASPFAQMAQWLVETYSVSELQELLVYTGDILGGEDRLNELQQAADRKAFQQDKELQARIQQLEETWLNGDGLDLGLE